MDKQLEKTIRQLHILFPDKLFTPYVGGRVVAISTRSEPDKILINLTRMQAINKLKIEIDHRQKQALLDKQTAESLTKGS